MTSAPAHKNTAIVEADASGALLLAGLGLLLISP
jgi:hypothetical protein